MAVEVVEGRGARVASGHRYSPGRIRLAKASSVMTGKPVAGHGSGSPIVSANQSPGGIWRAPYGSASGGGVGFPGPQLDGGVRTSPESGARDDMAALGESEL